jgi:hypothetical protein
MRCLPLKDVKDRFETMANVGTGKLGDKESLLLELGYRPHVI